MKCNVGMQCRVMIDRDITEKKNRNKVGMSSFSFNHTLATDHIIQSSSDHYQQPLLLPTCIAHPLATIFNLTFLLQFKILPKKINATLMLADDRFEMFSTQRCVHKHQRSSTLLGVKICSQLNAQCNATHAGTSAIM